MQITSEQMGFVPFSIVIESPTELALLWLALGKLSTNDINKAKVVNDYYPDRVIGFVRKLEYNGKLPGKSPSVKVFNKMVKELREFENGLQEDS